MTLNQKQKDFMKLSGFIAVAVIFVFIGMFFFRATPGFLGYMFDGMMESKGISISRVLGVLGFFIALLIAIMGIQSRDKISDRKRNSGGRW